MNESEELRMTYSGLLSQKNGEKIVRVAFERGRDYAEGIVPSGKIEKFSGFTADEVKQLSMYLLQNSNDILSKAKEVHPLRGFMRKK